MKFARSVAITFSLLVLNAASAPLPAAEPTYAKLLEKGEYSLKKKDYATAVATFTRVLKDNPSVYEAYLGRAAARSELQDTEGALKDYEAAIKANANVVEIYLQRGALQARLGQKDAAVRDYGEVLLLDPKNTQALLLRAQALQENGDYAGAVKDYDQYLKGNQSALNVRRQRADCNLNLSRYDDAIADYEYVLKKGGSKEFDIHYAWGEALSLKGDTRAANDQFNQAVTYYSRNLSRSRKNGLDYMYRGMAFEKLSEKGKALSDFSEAVRLLPQNPDALSHLAHVQLAGDDSGAALKNLDEAIRLNPRLDDALIDRASIYASQGNFEGSKKDLDLALSIKRSKEALYARAMTALSLGDIRGACADLNEASRISSAFVEAKRNSLAQELEQSQGKLNKSEQALNYSRLALYDLAFSDLASAERLVRQSTKLEQGAKVSGGAAVNLLLLGHIYLNEHSPVKAEAMFRTALTKMGSGGDGGQKYAVFSLEQCAKQLMASSKLEEAGSILAETRMLRASYGWTEQALTGEFSKKAEQAVEAYRLKRKYDRQEDLVRQVAVGSAENNTAGGGAVDSSQVEINRPIRDKWALIVGTGRFKEPSINLRFAAKDAQDFRDFLVKEKDFAPDHVQLLTNEAATRANILSLLGSKWLPRVAEKDDLVVIYFSTHGSPSSLDVGGVNYLVAYDTDPNDLYATGIAMQDLARIIKGRVHCDRIMVVLDACHSGVASPAAGKGIIKVANVDVEPIVQGTGQLVISSSQPDQRSWESQRYEGSVFTHYLIEGFRVNGQNTKLGDAYRFLETETQREVLRDRGILQTPLMRSKWRGSDLVLGAKPSAPVPGIGPIDLPDHIEQPAKNSQSAKTVQPSERRRRGGRKH